ncbi:hypothetical protein Hanom_Chr10g00874461 [Helianthus anomalus]
MFVPNFRRCPLPLILMSFVLNVSKSCTLCPLRQTQLIFLLNLIMCLAHESIVVISSHQGPLCKRACLQGLLCNYRKDIYSKKYIKAKPAFSL